MTTRPCIPTDAIALPVRAAELPRPAAELAVLADYYDERDTVVDTEAGLQAFLPLLARADAAGELPTP